jgi:thioredoxin reductase (NADPH)
MGPKAGSAWKARTVTRRPDCRPDRRVARDDRGFVLTGPDLRPDVWPLDRDPYLLESSMPAVFAVGDVRAQSVKRIASAVGEGSIAVQFVHQVLRHG